MDFFSAQDHARRSSRLLVLWFVLAVVGIIVTVYVALAAAIGLGSATEYASQYGVGASAAGPLRLWDPELFAMTAMAVGALILLGSVFKIIALSRNGGPAIAEELGGRLISRATGDPLERRLVNVVDEIAIASGIPAPPVYVLDAEQGINAFAAGSRVTEGVVAVTRGTLERLNRDELQGVIAHEFSHILNGDMRLNLRLIGVLHGILLLTLAGRVMMHSARRSDRGGAPFIIGGLALVLVGYIGVLFGKLIKAGVSRQREYLADAAAVQYTRNPAGIAGALKKIAGIGSEVHHPRAEEASHMFFGSSANFSRLMATHPPIQERIRRLDPSFDPAAQTHAAAATHGAAHPAAAGIGGASETPVQPGSPAFSPAGFAASIGTVLPEHVTQTQALLSAVPPQITDAAHQAGGARALVFALLLSTDPDVSARQVRDIEAGFGPDMREQAQALSRWVQQQDARVRLPLLDLAIPTLGELSDEARNQVVGTVDKLIEADSRTSVFEYVLRRLLHSTLQRSGQDAVKTVSLKTLKADTETLLALLARAGARDIAQSTAAFEAATRIAPLDGPWRADRADRRISIEDLDRILAHLAGARPAFRKKLVEAAATAVTHDGRVTATEAELLRAVCQALDCPAPFRA
ncbi:M48 family metallopeptidase [Rhodocyclaceae bacterium SMB388]